MAERELEDGAFYWVRLGDDWSVAERVTSRGEACWACLASEVLRPDVFWDEIGPCIGKEPGERVVIRRSQQVGKTQFLSSLLFSAERFGAGVRYEEAFGSPMPVGLLPSRSYVAPEPEPFAPSVEIFDGDTRLRLAPKPGMTAEESINIVIALQTFDDASWQEGSIIAWLGERNLLRHFEVVGPTSAP